MLLQAVEQKAAAVFAVFCGQPGKGFEPELAQVQKPLFGAEDHIGNIGKFQN